MRWNVSFLPLLVLAVACTDSSEDDTDTDVDTDSTVDDTDDTDVDVTVDCTAPGTICTVAGVAELAAFGPEDVIATESELYLPIDSERGPDGRLYVIDYNNHRLRYIDSDGTVHSFAGTGFLGDGPVGDAAAAAFNHPTNLAFHPLDDNLLYVAAWHNSRVEKITLDDNQVFFECGTGGRSYGGDNGPASTAALDLPSGLAFEDDGTFYISDSANQIIRKVDLEGNITTIAGIPPTVTGTVTETCATPPCTARQIGWSGDGGPADEAKFNFGFGQKSDPTARIVRDDRKLYVADSYNHVVRVIDLDSGQVDHVAGTGTSAGYAGDGAQAADAKLNYPTDVAVDASHNLYVADTYNHCIRKIAPDGVISTVAGQCGESGFGGDGGPATEAKLFRPYGVSYDPAGYLIISDTENHVVRTVAL